MLLVIGHNLWKRFTTDLLDVYDKLNPEGGFEAVFVAVRDDIPCGDIGDSTSTCSTSYGCFQERFSAMPWTAIPFSDLESWKHLERIFSIFGNISVDVVPISFVIDPKAWYRKTMASISFQRTELRVFLLRQRKVKMP